VGEFINSVNSGDDKSVALVWASLLEDALQTALTQKISHLDRDELSSLFGANGIISSFSAKIQMCYAFKIINESQKKKLNIIREIRNAFAHGVLDMSFETDQIHDVCRMLPPPKAQLADKRIRGRMIYCMICAELWTYLRDDVPKAFGVTQQGAYIPLHVTIGEEETP
jgi:hypothetical protein